MIPFPTICDPPTLTIACEGEPEGGGHATIVCTGTCVGYPHVHGMRFARGAKTTVAVAGTSSWETSSHIYTPAADRLATTGDMATWRATHRRANLAEVRELMSVAR